MAALDRRVAQDHDLERTQDPFLFTEDGEGLPARRPEHIRNTSVVADRHPMSTAGARDDQRVRASLERVRCEGQPRVAEGLLRRVRRPAAAQRQEDHQGVATVRRLAPSAISAP